MIQSLLERKIEKLPDQVRLPGRILFLTEDPALIQAASWRAKTCLGTPSIPSAIPNCATTSRPTRSRRRTSASSLIETLGEFPYTGLKCGNETPIQRGDVKRGGFVCAVSGKRRGKGSSREQSPYAEMCAGIKLVIAENIERIYKQNCQNLGVLTSTDFSLIDKIRARRGNSPGRVHPGRRRNHAPDHRVWRPVPISTSRACRAKFSCRPSQPSRGP